MEYHHSMDSGQMAADPKMAEMADLVTATNKFDTIQKLAEFDYQTNTRMIAAQRDVIESRQDLQRTRNLRQAELALSKLRHETARLGMVALAGLTGWCGMLYAICKGGISF